jgi:hypothetical protein
VYGAAPPAAVRVVVYATETGPEANAVLVIASGVAETASWNCRETVCADESVALIVTVALVIDVGVPEIKPALLKDNPGGRVPLAMLKVTVPEEPAVCSCREYGRFSVAPGNDVVEIESDLVLIVILN